MKKFTIFAILMLTSIMLPSVLATIETCSINIPINNHYQAGTLVLNASATWRSESATIDNNVTNVSFAVGSNTYWNASINGTATNTTGNAGVAGGDFTFKIATSSLSDGAYTVTATCYNDTAGGAVNSLDSSSRTLNIDNTNPINRITFPTSGLSVGVTNDQISITHIPSETNLGNATLYLNGAVDQSDTSLTSGIDNIFTKSYTADDSSEVAIVEITDLAGNKINSSSVTFSVIQSGGSVIVTSSSGGVSQGNTLIPTQSVGTSVMATQKVQKVKSFINQYQAVIGIVLIVGVILSFKYFKNN